MAKSQGKSQGKRKFYARAGKKYAYRKGKINSGSRGYININRKLDMISVAASATQGTPVITPATQTCVLLGTPTPTVGGLGTTYDVPFSLTFRLNQLRNYTELTQVFDQYKLNQVKIAIRSFANNDAPLGFPMPFISYFYDGDSNVPPTVDATRETMGIRTCYFNSKTNVCQIYVRPKVSIPAVTPTGVANALVTKGWLDCADPDVSHFSIKGIIHNYSLPAVTAGNNNLLWDITQNVSFKEVI